MIQDCNTCKNVSKCMHSCFGINYKKKFTFKIFKFLAK
nr:MAG TPA: hypothetical protein [Caudoviricetes sp.]